MSETRSGYRQSVSGLVGAIMMSMLLIGAIWLLTRFHDHQSYNPVPSVHYAQPLADAVAAGTFKPFAPDRVPAGWRATSASLEGTGSDVVWHLGFLTSATADAQYVGLDQSDQDAADFREATTRADQRGVIVSISGRRWQMWTSTDGGETALVLTGHNGSTTIVSGTAGESVLASFAGELTPR